MAVLAFAPGYLVPMLATLLGIYAFTRILSPAEYGYYAFVTSVMLLGQSALLAWVDQGAKRFFERAVQSGKLAAMCVTIYLGLAISALVLLAVCALGLAVFSVSPQMTGLLWIAAAVVIAKEISMVSKVLELAALSRPRYMLMECGESIIGVTLDVWLCWYLGFGAEGILLRHAGRGRHGRRVRCEAHRASVSRWHLRRDAAAANTGFRSTRLGLVLCRVRDVLGISSDGAVLSRTLRTRHLYNWLQHRRTRGQRSVPGTWGCILSVAGACSGARWRRRRRTSSMLRAPAISNKIASTP